VTKQSLTAAGLAANDVSQWLDEECNASQKIVILDCCYAGGFKGPADRDFASRIEGKGRYVMAAADRVPARDGASISPFTELVVKGLKELPNDSLMMDVLAHWVEEQAETQKLPKPHHKWDGSGSIVIADRSKGPASRMAAEPALPVLTLTFEDRTVEALVPDYPPRRYGPVKLRGAGSPQMNLLAELNRLAAIDALGQDPAARGMLDSALASARALAGQVLFDDLFDDELREALTVMVGTGRGDPRFQLRLDLTDAADDIVRAAWEYLGQAASSPVVARPLGERSAILTRGVRVATTGFGWKGGDGPIGTVVHSEFTEDHPMLAAIRSELEVLAQQSTQHPALRSVRPAELQPRGDWSGLTTMLTDPDLNVVVLVGRLKDINEASVLQLNEQEELREFEIDQLVDMRQGLPPLELIILEGLPHHGTAERAFGLTASFAKKLAISFGCPVVAVSHSGAYVASLPAARHSHVQQNDSRVEPQLSMLSAHVIDGLRRGMSVDRSTYDARQKIVRARTPMTAPIVYLPTRSESGPTAGGAAP
jgi:hypothetical protein